MEAGPLRVGVAVGAADTISGATAQRESPPVVASNKRPRRTSFLSPPERVPSPVKTLERQISLQEDTAVALDGASSVTGARSRGGARQSLSSTRRSLASAPVPPPSESRPWVQADFEVGHALGKGKFGNVYFAKEKASKVHVALKVQFKSALTSGGTQTLANFRREVEIHTRLHHPGLLTMYGYFHDAKSLYFILEYAAGGELYKLMKKSGGRFEERESLHYGSQALHAVSYLHERSVIHRDIKPENMLLDAAGNIKLTDFGWACHAPPPRANIRSTLCGTPEYISPEMVAGQPYGQEVDIWAIGVLLYELLSGVTPFGGKSPLTTELSDAMAADDQRLGVGTDDESHCIYDRIAAFKGKLSFPEGIGSSQSLHLVTQLLQPDPKQRPSASHVLRHEWIA